MSNCSSGINHSLFIAIATLLLSTPHDVQPDSGFDKYAYARIGNAIDREMSMILTKMELTLNRTMDEDFEYTPFYLDNLSFSHCEV